MRHKKAVNLYSWKGFVTKELTCIVKTFNWFFVIDMIWYREDKSICYDSWERKSWALMGKICAPVGVEDPHIIPNAQITTSSYYLSYYPHMGRLSGVKGWLRKLLQSPMTTYKLIWERFTQSAQSQRKGRKMVHASKATSCPSLLMKAAGVYIRNKTLTRFEIILL